MLPPYTGPVTRSRSIQPNIPAATSTIDIDANGALTHPNASLVIPYHYIFDVPHPNAADIALTSARLSSFALAVYQN
jgi:hypothetical protein